MPRGSARVRLGRDSLQQRRVAVIKARRVPAGLDDSSRLGRHEAQGLRALERQINDGLGVPRRVLHQPQHRRARPGDPAAAPLRAAAAAGAATADTAAAAAAAAATAATTDGRPVGGAVAARAAPAILPGARLALRRPGPPQGRGRRALRGLGRRAGLDRARVVASRVYCRSRRTNLRSRRRHRRELVL